MTERMERRGMALAMSLMAIVIVGALISGGYFLSMQDYRSGRNSLPQARSMTAAEYGQNEALRNWSSLGATGLTKGQTSAAFSYTTPSNGKASVRLTRIQDNLFTLVADGGAGNSTVGSDARRRTGLLIRLQVPDIDMLGALTTRGQAKMGGSSMTDGNDYVPPGMTCGPAKAAKPGLVIPDEDQVTYSGCANQDCLAGSPKILESPAAAHDSTYLTTATCSGMISWRLRRKRSVPDLLISCSHQFLALCATQPTSITGAIRRTERFARPTIPIVYAPVGSENHRRFWDRVFFW